MAVRFSSTEAYCPVTPSSWRTTWAPAYVVPEDLRLATVDRQQGGEHLEHGGLAGAVGSEDAEDLAAADLEVDAVDRTLFAEVLHQAAGRDSQGGFSQQSWYHGDGRPVSPWLHDTFSHSRQAFSHLAECTGLCTGGEILCTQPGARAQIRVRGCGTGPACCGRRGMVLGSPGT